MLFSKLAMALYAAALILASASFVAAAEIVTRLATDVGAVGTEEVFDLFPVILLILAGMEIFLIAIFNFLVARGGVGDADAALIIVASFVFALAFEAGDTAYAFAVLASASAFDNDTKECRFATAAFCVCVVISIAISVVAI